MDWTCKLIARLAVFWLLSPGAMSFGTLQEVRAEEFAKVGASPKLIAAKEEASVVRDESDFVLWLLSEWPKPTMCTTCEEGLCQPCVDRDALALKGCALGWETWDLEKQSSAIVRIAQLQAQHAQVANPKAVDFLVGHAQEDGPWRLRVPALFGLASLVENQPVLYSHLETRLEQFHPNALKAQTEFLENRAKLQGWRIQDLRNTGIDPVKRAIEIHDLKIVVFRQLVNVIPLETELQVLWMAIGSIPGEAATATLLKYLPSFEGVELPSYYMDALLNHPTIERVEAALHNLVNRSMELEAHDRLIRQAKKKKVGKVQEWFLKNNKRSEWKKYRKAIFKKELDGLLEERLSKVEKLQEEHDKLSGWATARTLTPPKIKKELFRKGWLEWIRRNGKALGSTGEK